MGIRFSCPNGHKLHVKAFLAGKRGICPHCGVHFRVPSAEGQEAGSSSELLSVQEAVPPVAAAAKSPAAPPARASGPQAVPPMVPPVTGTQPAPAQADIFPQDPASIWYVRPTQGGQYGPASASVMRSWIVEGRVPPDAYVWSHGWAEWQKASAVIPRGLLEAVGRSLQPAPVLAASLPAASGKEKMTTVDSYRQRQAHRRSLNVVTWLGITSLLLLAALVYVIGFRR